MNVLFTDTDIHQLNKDLLILDIDMIETKIEKSGDDFLLKIKAYKNNIIFLTESIYHDLANCERIRSEIFYVSNEIPEEHNGVTYPTKTIVFFCDKLTIKNLT